MQPVEICRVPPSRLRTFFDLKIEEFQRVLELNLTGTVLLHKSSSNQWWSRRQALLSTSPAWLLSPHDARSRICCRKSRYLQFHSFHATEVAKKFGEGIRVNAIAPGFFLTEQNRALLTNPDGSYTERGQDVIRQTPFGRMGRAEELCGTIQYLISDASSFVTGTVAVVDGGFNGIRHVNSKLQSSKQ